MLDAIVIPALVGSASAALTVIALRPMLRGPKGDTGAPGRTGPSGWPGRSCEHLTSAPPVGERPDSSDRVPETRYGWPL